MNDPTLRFGPRQTIDCNKFMQDVSLDHHVIGYISKGLENSPEWVLSMGLVMLFEPEKTRYPSLKEAKNTIQEMLYSLEMPELKRILRVLKREKAHHLILRSDTIQDHLPY